MTPNPISTFIQKAKRAGVDFAVTPYEDIEYKDILIQLFGPDAIEAIKESGYPGGAMVPWTAEYLHIYPADEISARQAGYKTNALTNVDEARWDKGHWVFADWSADPFTAGPNHEIFYSRHGMGAWKYASLFKDITIFFGVLSIWIEFFTIDNDGEIFDDDFFILPEKRADFARRIEESNIDVDKDAMLDLFLRE